MCWIWHTGTVLHQCDHKEYNDESKHDLCHCKWSSISRHSSGFLLFGFMEGSCPFLSVQQWSIEQYCYQSLDRLSKGPIPDCLCGQMPCPPFRNSFWHGHQPFISSRLYLPSFQNKLVHLPYVYNLGNTYSSMHSTYKSTSNPRDGAIGEAFGLDRACFKIMKPT